MTCLMGAYGPLSSAIPTATRLFVAPCSLGYDVIYGAATGWLATAPELWRGVWCGGGGCGVLVRGVWWWEGR